MLPWIVYAAWRGRHGHLSPRGALAVLLLDLVGCVVVWLFVLGPVVRLGLLTRRVCRHLGQRLAARRRLAGQDRYVRIEEFRNADDS